MLPLLGAPGLTSSIQVRGEVLYLTFRAHRNGTDELIATDTFVIHDDLIHMHTFYATSPSPSPTADNRRRIDRPQDVASNNRPRIIPSC